MRMSCNGCRVLRKGCTDGCSIRPCLQWIKNPEAQANATVFLAKFYGRAGLLNLVNTGPDHLRPHIFQSLLYEACGRIVNPIYGSVGLLWSGNWQMCQAAVEAVLKGQPIVQVSSDAAAAAATPPLKAYDIRHVSKDHANDSLHKVAKPGRRRFKRASSSSASKPKPAAPQPEQEAAVHAEDGFVRAPSHESWASHDHVDNAMPAEEAHHEASVDTDVEGAGSHVSQAEQSPLPLVQTEDNGDGEVSLELTLGLAPVARTRAAA